MKTLLTVCMLLLMSGCMTRHSVLSMIEEHHATEVVPVMTEQAASIEDQHQRLSSYVNQLDEDRQMLLSYDDRISENKKQVTIAKVRIDDNTHKVIESNDQLDLHRELLFETYRQQKGLAEAAMGRLKERFASEAATDVGTAPDDELIIGE